VRISIDVSGMSSDAAWKVRAAMMDMLLKMAAVVQALPGDTVFAVDDGASR
jgi:flagellar motor protein MotB